MIDKNFWITLFILTCLGIYLFVSAPPPLNDDKPQTATIPVQQLFTILQQENAAVRALWTKEIVGAGQKVGLKFDEHWRDDDLDAGPLPALFLRETAKSMERSPIRISLFLGSDYPISPDNRFEGLQQEKFQLLRQTQQPQFFYMADTRLYTAMFADIAVAPPCIDCHNEHEQSPKRDWRLLDVMGGTTWMYPTQFVSLEELFNVIMVLHHGFKDAYSAYLEKVKTFSDPPVIGDNWPREGYFLPRTEVFMQEVLKRTAPDTLIILGSLTDSARSRYSEELPIVTQ
ncbi:MAG: c-type heme family protein [Gammaproteobacteria bacterium]